MSQCFFETRMIVCIDDAPNLVIGPIGVSAFPGAFLLRLSELCRMIHETQGVLAPTLYFHFDERVPQVAAQVIEIGLLG